MIKKRKLFTLLSALGIGLAISSGSASAAVLDNDALSTAPGQTSQSGSWTYGTGSGYNNDYRIASAGSGSFQYSGYVWGYNVKNVTGNYGVYLSNKNFNNSSTAYQIGENGGYVYINQNTAPSGWSSLKRYQGYN
ncbi:hypothetical protein P9X50_23875, partial [Bacillus cereus]|nr:hypothetical protein [Bacillus cereus]